MIPRQFGSFNNLFFFFILLIAFLVPVLASVAMIALEIDLYRVVQRICFAAMPYLIPQCVSNREWLNTFFFR